MTVENQPLEDEIGEISPEMQAFFQRADQFINLANSQLGTDAHSAQVSSSLMYASARFTASVASIGFKNGEDFLQEKEKVLEFYTRQFREMLSGNIDDYAQNFNQYVHLDNKG